MGKLSATAWKSGVTGIWAIALVVAFATTSPKPWALTVTGIVLGCISGYRRSRALRTGAPPRGAKILSWLCAIGLLILAMAIADNMFLGAWAASFAGYLLLSAMFALSVSYGKEQGRLGVAADGT